MLKKKITIIRKSSRKFPKFAESRMWVLLKINRNHKKLNCSNRNSWIMVVNSIKTSNEL